MIEDFAHSHMTRREDTKRMIDAVKRRPLRPIVAQRTTLKRVGAERWTGLCPFHAEKTPSFNVDDKKGFYHCFGCGAHGSVIDFLMNIDNMDFDAALQSAAAFYGLVTDVTGFKKQEFKPVEASSPEDDVKRKAAEIVAARTIWQAGLPTADTIVETYLGKTRCIPLRQLHGGGLPPTIRFHPALEYWHDGRMLGAFPAMIAPMQNIKREMTAIHMTYLDARTADKIRIADPHNLHLCVPAKKMRGSAWGCGIRLSAVAVKMAVTEGIENALTCMACGSPPAWAAGSLNNLSGYGMGAGVAHPRRIDKKLPSIYPDLKRAAFNFPPDVHEVVILPDNDSKDPESAEALFERAGRRLSHGGRIVSYVWPRKGMDFNDMLRERLA